MSDKCQGNCSTHSEEVYRVRVTGRDGYDWGEWVYCQRAINEDERNGMKVEFIEETP